MTQKLPIATLDHSQAIPHEILDGVSQRRCLPGLIGHAHDAEDGFGDLAIACAAAPAIDGLQHVACAAQLLSGQPGIRRNRAFVQCLDEANDGFCAVEAIRVDGNYGRQGLRPVNICQSHKMQRLAVPELMLEVFARFVTTDLVRIEHGVKICVRGKERWNARQDDNAAVFFRRPEDGDFHRIESRVDKEIAGPSGGVGRS